MCWWHWRKRIKNEKLKSKEEEKETAGGMAAAVCRHENVWGSPDACWPQPLTRP